MATQTEQLAQKHCKPCSGETPALKGNALQEMLGHIEGWELIEDQKIAKNFKFNDFRTTLDFVNKVGELAEMEDHHPNICFTWGRCRIELSTHKVDGLSENDFILAAKIDQLPK